MNSWAALFFSIRWLSLHFLVCLSRRACFHWQQKEEKQNLLAPLLCAYIRTTTQWKKRSERPRKLKKEEGIFFDEGIQKGGRPILNPNRKPKDPPT